MYMIMIGENLLNCTYDLYEIGLTNYVCEILR